MFQGVVRFPAGAVLFPARIHKDSGQQVQHFWLPRELAALAAIKLHQQYTTVGWLERAREEVAA